MPSEDTVIIWKNNVLHCRSLSSSMETATDQFPEIHLLWTSGVIVRQPSHVVLYSVNLWEQ